MTVQPLDVFYRERGLANASPREKYDALIEATGIVVSGRNHGDGNPSTPLSIEQKLKAVEFQYKKGRETELRREALATRAG